MIKIMDIGIYYNKNMQSLARKVVIQREIKLDQLNGCDIQRI